MISNDRPAAPVFDCDQPPAFSLECKCEPFTCRPQNNIDRFCWRSGCPIYAKDFPDTSPAEGK